MCSSFSLPSDPAPSALRGVAVGVGPGERVVYGCRFEKVDSGGWGVAITGRRARGWWVVGMRGRSALGGKVGMAGAMRTSAGPKVGIGCGRAAAGERRARARGRRWTNCGRCMVEMWFLGWS